MKKCTKNPVHNNAISIFSTNYLKKFGTVSSYIFFSFSGEKSVYCLAKTDFGTLPQNASIS